MTEKKRFITLSGSLRSASFNSLLARNAADYLKAKGHDAQVIDLNDYPLPFFNEDTESQAPETLDKLRAIFTQADGLVIASPEYNGSFSAVLKNTIDWLSRPSKEGYQSTFSQQAVALIATSPGALGGIRGLSQLRELMGNLGSLIVPSQLAIGSAYTAFSDTNELENPVMKERFEAILDSLIELS